MQTEEYRDVQFERQSAQRAFYEAYEKGGGVAWQGFAKKPLQSFWTSFEFPEKPEPEEPPKSEEQTCIQILAREGIKTRKDFLKWSLKHHPDKKGTSGTQLFQVVSACVDSQ